MEKIRNAFQTFFPDWQVIAACSRPDKHYAIAVATAADYDYPQMLLLDAKDNSCSVLSSSDSMDLIDWPGEDIRWPKNDFRPRTFARLNGLTEFAIDKDAKTYQWLGRIERYDDEIKIDEWWINIDVWYLDADWHRLRTYLDGTVQHFYKLRNKARYDHYLKYQDARLVFNRNHLKVGIDNYSRAIVMNTIKYADRTVIAKIQQLLNVGTISLPFGKTDSDLLAQMHQVIERS